MIDARRVDSAAKRARVVAAITAMTEADEPITPTAVARRAGVSSWLVYHPDLRAVIETARAAQAARNPATPAATATAGVFTDLALARAEIARLRTERDDQRRQIQRALGARLDDIAKTDLLARVDQLTRHNTGLAAEVTRANQQVTDLTARVAELEDDLTAARTSLRRMIRAENLPAATPPPRPQGVSR